MKRNLKTLTEQFTDARSNYNRILGRVDKTLMNEQSGNKIILSEQWSGSTPTNAGGFRACKCSQVDSNGTCDTWGLNNMGNADYHFTQWNSFHKIGGQAPQVGDIITAFGVDRYVDRVNPTPDLNCYNMNGTIGVPCTTPNNYNGQGAYNWSSNPNPSPSCPVSPTPCTTYGCTDSTASNYNSTILPNCDDNSCVWLGCTDSTASNYDPVATVDDGTCITTSSCDTSTSSPCAVQWFQNPNANWASTWITNRDCSNYNWPSVNLEQQANTIMAGAPNQPTIPYTYNSWNDIWSAGQNSGLSPANAFIAKMAKAKYSQCQIQACNC